MKALWLTVLLVVSAYAPCAAPQPLPPQLTLAEGETVPGGRLEFAPIPEVAFVRGLAETVQLGPFQMDPSNRWQAGDLTRSSGWLSAHLTKLIDVATGQPVPSTIVAYDGATAELKYAGTWSGDVTVRLEATGKASEPFRIRVMTPTVVYGDNAVAINTQYGWGANLCPTPMSFVTCRKERFKGGGSDVAPLVIFFTPGRYTENVYVPRRFVYVLSHPTNRVTLVNYAVACVSTERCVVANLTMIDSNISHGRPSPNWPSSLNISRVYQCCETNVRSGVVNPNTRTVKPQRVEFWNSESKGMGSAGNTQHGMYVEMRPDSRLYVTNVRFMASNGSSSLKSTMADVQFRYCLFNVSREYDEPNLGEPSGHYLTHTMADIVGVADIIAFGNHFRMWRQKTAGVTGGYWGTLTAAIFVRRRREMYGSDKPSYPITSWNPPVGEGAGAPPGGNWSGAAATFVADNFWRDVTAKPITDPTNEYSFKHFIGFNRFELLPGSLSVNAVRDDGTHPIKAMQQFSSDNIAKRTHPLWIERSVNFLYGNEYLNYGDAEQVDLNNPQGVKSIEPGAKWPRDAPEEFPKAIELTGELPTWFKL